MPDKPYIDEHGLPRFADGTVDHDEWRLIAIEEKLNRIYEEQQDRIKLEQGFSHTWLEEHARYAAMPWWRRLWEVRP